jgi:hypothetical protein
MTGADNLVRSIALCTGLGMELWLDAPLLARA